MSEKAIILAVDDTTESLALLGRILTDAGYELRLADSGELALDAMATQLPDLILLDIRMPGMDGLQMCEHLKSADRTRHIPVILMSAFAEVNDWVQGLRLGAVDYISKPFQTEELLSRVRTHLALNKTEGLKKEALALRQANAELEADITKRRVVEVQLRQTLIAAEISRRAEIHAATERQRAEASLRHANDRYRWLVETANEGIWTMDANHVTTFANQAMADMLGYTTQEVIGRKVEEFFFPEDAEFHAARMRNRHAGQDEKYDRRFRRKDGSELWTRVSARAMTDDAGAFCGSFAMFTDITERRRIEDSLRQSEGNLRSLFDAIPESVFMMDTKGIVLAANATFASRVGRSVADCSGINVLNLVPPAVAARRRLWIAEVLQSQKPIVYEDENQPRCTRHSICPVVEENGEVHRIVVVAVDITAIRQAEAALRQWADAFAHCAHGIAMGHPKGNSILICNPALARMLGRTVEEVAGTPILSIYAPEYHERIKSWIAEADRTGQVRYEAAMVRKDGTVFPVQMDVVSVRNPDGGILYRVATTQDITERRQAEAQRETLAQRWKLALDAARLGWWHYDPRTRMSTWDERYKEIFGVTESARPNEEMLARLHPDDLRGVWAAVEAALDPVNPQPYAVEYRVRHPDGSIRWVQAHGLAEFAGEAQARHAVSFVGTVADVTEPKLAEMERQRHAGLIKSLLDSIPDLIFYKDLNGVYLVVHSL